jgi:hypothetical protein
VSTKWPKKDPDEKLDYSINWNTDEDGDVGSGRLLPGDMIVISEWFSPVGITVVSEGFSSTMTTIWLTGGAVGETYEFLNRVTTAAGRIMDKTVFLKMKEH